MPTKRFYVNAPFGGNAPDCSSNFNAAGSCDDIAEYLRSRRAHIDNADHDLAAAASQRQRDLLGSERHHVQRRYRRFQQRAGFDKRCEHPGTSGFQNGWLNLGFPSRLRRRSRNVHTLINVANTAITTIGGGTTFGNTTTYFGLPVVGFAVVSYSNGTLTVGQPPVNVLSNYGGNFKHKNNTKIQ
jgi:hypothetical protein